MANTFVWYELVTTDVAAAERFYGEVAGWKSEPFGDDYKIMQTAAGRVGGMMPLPKEACEAGVRPCWLGYIGVSDLASALAKLQQAGGVVHKAATEIPQIGSFAVVADPTGAAFILFLQIGRA